MIKVYNNRIEVSKNDKRYNEIKRVFKGRREQVKGLIEYIDLYSINPSTGALELPRGYDTWLSNLFELDYELSSTIDISNFSVDDIYSCSKLSDEVTLREDQIVALKKMLYLKRGIVQLATGSGKTEIMSAFLKCIYKILGYYPPTLVLEPSILLVEGTIERFKKYDIPAKDSSEFKDSKIDGVVVSHPLSLNKIIEKDPNILDNLVILLSDEGHHLQANTWNTITINSKNLEYSLCMSALVIDYDKIPSTNSLSSLLSLSLDELRVIGGTGRVLINISPDYYIRKGVLSYPHLYRIYTLADEKVSLKSWARIRKVVLESDYRISLVSKLASYLCSCGYKTLILVGTKVVANKITKLISNYTGESLVRSSFGGSAYYKYDPDLDKVVKCKKDEDVKSKFDNSECRILVGTSHIYEGADIPNLDAVILVEVGRSSRKYIQGVGRCLRKTKTGKYAHIIDFTDSRNPILSYHSVLRRKMFVSKIGGRNIYDNLSFEEFKKIFARLELEGNNE